ncbi:transcription elongation protein SprT [Halomicrobium mukohataei]|uniref:Transcription elongation protein SprT n=1 Tax=Halomicrobium mukohataei TaxID=57705 RepID=A0A847UFY7_9EURY|nr:SprT-like domain-containing protein [Halomicrobium mukohataei]NLV09988.1 transcription elongation protein SprT [Halomicrobium mukohataei]
MDAPVEFDAIDDHDDLIAWSRAYCKHARREWLVDVRLDLVEWTVSTRARRRAAAVRHPQIDDATVDEALDWDAVPAADGRPLACTLSLTWDAFREFSQAEWASTLRHELIHVEQYQHCGTTGHGAAFRRRAETLDTEVHCRTFADARWTFQCRTCGTVVARRYRDCPFVREYDRYRSDCCGDRLRRVERTT